MKVTVTYDQVKARATRSGYCPVCKRRTKRTQAFVQTVNPFNLNADGNPKTYEEVQREVNREAREWEPEPATFIHSACQS